MAKPTSMASMVANQAATKSREEAKEDEKLARRDAEDGKVWVRLIRPHYDHEGVLHREGPALLDEDKVPQSAKVLTKRAEIAGAKAEAEDDPKLTEA